MGLHRLEDRLEELSHGSWEEVTGLPFGVGGRMHEALTRELDGTRLLQETYVPEVRTPVIGPIRLPVTVSPPVQVTDVHGNWLAGNRSVY